VPTVLHHVRRMDVNMNLQQIMSDDSKIGITAWYSVCLLCFIMFVGWM